MRLRQALPKTGPVKDRWSIHHAKSRADVMARFVHNGMKCEGHDERIYQAPEWHHVFGRRHLVEEPYCSSPELTAALCHFDPRTNSIGCHEKVTRRLDPVLNKKLEVAAATRFYEAHNAKKIALIQTEPVGAVRRLITKIEKAAA